MRFLNRSSRGPTCLEDKDYNIHDFERHLSQSQKKAIWRELNKMQDELCAYCEKKVAKRHRQIEHFYSRQTYREKTFDWHNLFGGCISAGSEHCGQFKDRDGEKSPKPYNPAELIKPDEHNPAEFFSYSKDGYINIKQNSNDQQQARADETLRVLNLTSSVLTDSRAAAIARYQQRLTTIFELPPEHIEIALNQLKEDIAKVEFRTSIHFVLFKI